MAPRDPYARSSELDDATAEALATRLETRGAEPRQRAMCQTFLFRLPRRPGTWVLEVGRGTGTSPAIWQLLRAWTTSSGSIHAASSSSTAEEPATSTRGARFEVAQAG